MEIQRPTSESLNCARNCTQVAYILRNKICEDREQLAEDQLREASRIINKLLSNLGEPHDRYS
jgi:hypothetical protein